MVSTQIINRLQLLRDLAFNEVSEILAQKNKIKEIYCHLKTVLEQISH